MKTYTNHAPGMRGITVNSDAGPAIRYLDPGESVELDPELVLAVPDLGAPGAAASNGDDELARLRTRVAELEDENGLLKAKLAKLSPSPSPADIKAAIDLLDAKNDEHWTEAGLPAVDAVKTALGADVTRSQIEAAAPDAKRPAAR